MSSKGVILVGGPSVGTRFRPLSMDCPKPLFPIAGKPMIYHHIRALSKLPSVTEILIIGFFDNSLFTQFIFEVEREIAEVDHITISIRYLREYQSLGTGGGIYHFRDEIMRGSPDHIFVMNADICSSFPLQEMLDFHSKTSTAIATVLGIRVERSTVQKYGCLVVEPSSHEVRHFVEKPETFISDLISCGVYLFSKDIFDVIREAIYRQRALIRETGEVGSESVSSSQQLASSPRVSLSTSPRAASIATLASKALDERVRLEQDVLASLAGSGKLFAYVRPAGEDFWMQIKTGDSAIPANRMYLQYFKKHQPRRLSRPSPVINAATDEGLPSREVEIVEPVFIHPTALIHPTAKIGPNVSIGPRVLIRRGVRIRDAIILDSVEIRNETAVIHSIIGWESKIGAWARVEGHLNSTSSAAHDGSATAKGTKIPSATILGKGVSVADEVIIRSCIVLPHKDLKSSFHNEILM